MDILSKIKTSEKFDIEFIEYLVLKGQEPDNFLILSEISSIVVDNFEKSDSNSMNLDSDNFLRKHKRNINRLAPYFFTDDYNSVYDQYIRILESFISSNNNANIKTFNLVFLTLISFAIKLNTFLANNHY